MKLLVIGWVLFLLACNNAEKNDAGNASALRFDGMYKSALQTNGATGDQSTSYLRFYDDGTVINVSSSGTPAQIKNWFVKGHENVRQGAYRLTGDNVSFRVGDNASGIESNGKAVNRERLELHTKSLANAHEEEAMYSFVAD